MPPPLPWPDEAAAPALRSGVAFGMTADEVIAAEPSARYEMEREHTHGPVDFDELEYEDVTENGIYAVDDDGRPEGAVEAWTVGSVMIVLENDRDGITVTFVDLSAAWLVF